MNLSENSNVKSLREKFIQSLGDYIFGVGETTRVHVFSLATSLYGNPSVKKDVSLYQSVSFVNFLADQIKNGNQDVLNYDLVEQLFTYVLRKLVARSGYKHSPLLNKHRLS